MCFRFMWAAKPPRRELCLGTCRIKSAQSRWVWIYRPKQNKTSTRRNMKPLLGVWVPPMNPPVDNVGIFCFMSAKRCPLWWRKSPEGKNFAPRIFVISIEGQTQVTTLSGVVEPALEFCARCSASQVARILNENELLIIALLSIALFVKTHPEYTNLFWKDHISRIVNNHHWGHSGHRLASIVSNEVIAFWTRPVCRRRLFYKIVTH